MHLTFKSLHRLRQLLLAILRLSSFQCVLDPGSQLDHVDLDPLALHLTTNVGPNEITHFVHFNWPGGRRRSSRRFARRRSRFWSLTEQGCGNGKRGCDGSLEGGFHLESAEPTRRTPQVNRHSRHLTPFIPDSEGRGAAGVARLGCTRRRGSPRLYPIDTAPDLPATCATNAGGECVASNFGVRVYPTTLTTTDLTCGARRCSKRKIPCHVPSANLPSITGITSDVRVNAIRKWLGISSAPSCV